MLTYRKPALLALLFPPAGVPAMIHSLRAGRLAKARRVEEARIQGGKARDWAWIAVGVGLTCYVVVFLVWLLFANHGAVRRTYFKPDVFFGVKEYHAVAGSCATQCAASIEFHFKYWSPMLRAFWLNIQVFLITEIIVLIWALVVAIVRLLPGKVCAPLRWLATLYVDIFRGLPSILVIFLVGFGFPLAGVPIVQDWSKMQFAIIALTLTYGAYVSEVYKAGIESVHWGQTAAARSLGLSYAQTMRHVVVPQALRRIGPPLLNDFIGLQKDTATIFFIGAFDALAMARFINNNNATFAAYTMAAVLFLAVTVPFTRYLDHILKRQKLRTQGGT